MFFGALLCKDHLHTCILGGVEGNTLPITGSVEPADLPEIITAVGPYKTAHIVGGVFTRDMDFEAFEEDSGLNMGSVVAAENQDEEDQLAGSRERRRPSTDQGR